MSRSASRLVERFALAVLALCAFGCDTLGEVWIGSPTVVELTSVGATNAVSCTASDVDVVWRFSLLTTDHLHFEQEALLPGAITFTEAVLEPGSIPVVVEPYDQLVPYVSGDGAHRVIVLMDNSGSLRGNHVGGLDRTTATDPQDVRIAAVQSFAFRLLDAEPGIASVCLMTAGGEGPAGVRFEPSRDSCFVSTEKALSDVVRTTTLTAWGGSPIWDAMALAAETLGDTGRRSLLLFVDGPDDASLYESSGSTRRLMRDAGVTVHVVHLDGDASGPNADFSRLACATGGSYQYVADPLDLREPFIGVADTLPGHYELALQLGTLASDELPTGAYTLSSTGVVSIDGVQFGFDQDWVVWRR